VHKAVLSNNESPGPAFQVKPFSAGLFPRWLFWKHQARIFFTDTCAVHAQGDVKCSQALDALW